MKENGLIYIEGKEDIEADGQLVIEFSVNLDKKFAEASPEEVSRELMELISDGQFNVLGPVLSYQILGP